jgi:hypothetical protein
MLQMLSHPDINQIPHHRNPSFLFTAKNAKLHSCITSLSAIPPTPGGGGRLPREVCLNFPSSYLQVQTSSDKYSSLFSMLSHRVLYAFLTLLYTLMMLQKSGLSSAGEEHRTSCFSRPLAMVTCCQLQTTLQWYAEMLKFALTISFPEIAGFATTRPTVSSSLQGRGAGQRERRC